MASPGLIPNAPTLHLVSARGLHPLTVASDIGQLPARFHCVSPGPAIAPRSGRRLRQALRKSTTPMQTTTESAERRLQELAIQLPVPPEPFGTYTEAVQVGSLLFLSGTLPTEGRTAKFVGRVGAELDTATGREAARLAAMNAVAITRQHLGTLDRVKRIVRLGVSVATEGNVRDQPKVADGASDFLQEVFGADKNPTRLVFGVASLPLGVPVEVELILEVQP